MTLMNSFSFHKKAFRKAISIPLRLRNRLRVIQNRRFLATVVGDDITVRPIFVIGPPRCGSTLFYQAMTYCFNFCYFTNEMMSRPYDVASYIERQDCSIGHFSSFTSNHGRTEKDGPTAPHEAWPFWRRFYPRATHDYIENPKHLKRSEELEIRRTLQFMVEHFGCPFISKNMEIGLRLRSVQRIFPNAVYIVIKRDPRGIASSLLGARLKDYGNPEVWWSMRPVDFAAVVGEDVPTQLAGQILGVYRAIYSDMNPSHVFELYYEDFCYNPQKEIGRVGAFLEDCGINAVPTGQPVPSRFAQKTTFLLSRQELNKLVDLLQANDVFCEHLCFRLNNM